MPKRSHLKILSLVLVLTLLCGCARAPSEPDFVPDGARAFEAQLRNPTGVPSLLVASHVHQDDAMIIGEGKLEASGAFSFSFDNVLPPEILENPWHRCDALEVSNPEAGLLFVRKFDLLSEDEEILGDIAQASSVGYLKGTSDRGELGLYVYTNARLRLKGNCLDDTENESRVESRYDLSLKQGWNAVLFGAEPGKQSYSSTPHTLPWLFLALEN